MKKTVDRTRSLKNTSFRYCPGCGHTIIHRLIAEVID
jgi:2-oxoglutarate ferredoxin oxidoreductase subunit beta